MTGTISVADGARTILFCATSSRAVKKSGGCIVLFGRLRRRRDKWNYGDELLSELWTKRGRMVKEAGF